MLALVGWVGVRAFSLGMIPGAEALAFDGFSPTAPEAPDKASLPPVLATEFPPLDPVAPPPPYPVAAASYGAYPPQYAQPYAVPYPVPVYAAGMSRAPAAVRYASSPALPRQWGPGEVQGFSLAPAAARYAEATPLDQWPIAAIASGRSSPTARVRRSTPAELIRSIPGIDRLSMSGWAMMRRDPGSPSLAANGQLGGSQAGARILWRFHRDLALSFRSSAPVGGVQRTAEMAAGLRWQPLRQIPIALTAERRQSFGPDKGPPAFALFAEGGLYDRPIVAGFNLDAYLQAGVVGLRERAGFVDGSATLTRPLWRQFSAGIGMWGGAQPGLARFDVGPRLSYRIGSKMRVHVDYRQRLLGQAAPGSGPVLTLAANF
jgi:hypothetical protein